MTTYQIPHSDEFDAAAASATTGSATSSTPADTAGGDALTWTAPSDWQSETASSMRKATYTITGPNGATADLSITAFPGDVGGELANVNRWRGQMNQGALTTDQLDGATTLINANSLRITFVDLSDGSSNPPQRLLGAIVPLADETWFFKLSGPDSAVGPQRDAFVDFLKSIRRNTAATVASSPATPTPEATPDMTNIPVPTATDGKLAWSAPATWESRPASAMRKATFAVPGPDGTEGDLSITAFPGDVGGELANVNRWRGQMGLDPIDQVDLPTQTLHLDVQGLHITFVDLTGASSASGQSLLGAIVPLSDDTWFFKLSGATAVVAPQRDTFLAFLKTLHIP